MKDIKYYLIGETFWESVLSDTWTVVAALFGAAVNRYLLGDNYWFSLFFVLMLVSVALAKAGPKVLKFKTSADLIKHLQEAKAND